MFYWNLCLIITFFRDAPERVVIFSQYPQYSCSTSGSSFNSIYTHYKKNSIPDKIKWGVVDRWPTHPLLAKTFAERIKDELKNFPEEKRKDVILMFSAHSLPMKVFKLKKKIYWTIE